MNILQVSTADIAGGAARVARTLHHQFRARGHEAWMVVGTRRSTDDGVIQIPADRGRSLWTRAWLRAAKRLDLAQGEGPAKWMAYPRQTVEQELGLENMRFPATRHLLDITLRQPDLVHCHNLHGGWLSAGGYFDLGELPRLSRNLPVMLTLHDAWLLSGHCAHPLDCPRWQTGCGHCPYPEIYLPIKRDSSAANWRRKQRIYKDSRLYIASPARWLADRVTQSILAPAIADMRVIPYGLELDTFLPGDKQAARAALGIDPDATVMLFAANGIRRNVWKDYQTMRAAIEQVASRLEKRRVLFIALGETAPDETIGSATISFIPFQRDERMVAQYYRAADVYVHAARADTFPVSVLEALACGTPVVGTRIGGIPEQVVDLASADARATGILTPPGDANAMAEAIIRLLTDNTLSHRLGQNAVTDARQRFNVNRQVDEYLTWFDEILQNQHSS